MRRRMNYYLNDGFPMLQEPAAGPYVGFPGTPRAFAPACRLRVPLIRGLGAFGDVPDVVEGMVGEGYDPSVISSLVSAGATESQLQSLWDTTEPGSSDFAQSASEKLFLLTSGQQGHLTMPAASSPASAAPAPSKPPAAPGATATHPFPIYGPLQPALQPVYVQQQPQPSWISKNWPWLVGGGVVLVLLTRH